MSRIRFTDIVSTTYNVQAAGDRFTVPHGLTNAAGYPITPTAVFATAHAADADGAITTPPVVLVVSVDDAEAVIRCNVDATDVDLLFVYEADYETAV